MKIAQITYNGFGGLGSVVFSLVEAVEESEHVWLIGFIGDQPLETSYPSRCAEHEVVYKVFRSMPGRPYRAWFALSRWLNEVRPDAVICHSINSILACRWYAWRHGARLIAVEHTSNQVKTKNEWAASRVSMLLADQIVVLTEEYRQELQLAHGRLFRPEKVTVIPNGVNTEVFFPSSIRCITEPVILRIGMAARFSFSKRQDMLVSILERLSEISPEISIELSLAGDGSELERVKAFAACSSATSQIRFDGLLSEQDIAPWLRGLDIYVHATDGETLSTSLLQAMATGLPIVASDIPGVRNLLGLEEEYGCCVPNDTEVFSRAILDLLNDQTRRVALGERARARIEDSYSAKIMLQRYLNAIGESSVCQK